MRLSLNGGPETPFAQGAIGIRIFRGVEAGATYEFRLYEPSSSAPLRSVTVTSEAIKALTASPLSAGPVPGVRKATIGCNLPIPGGGEVYVSADGGPEELFARGEGGAQEAPWLATGKSYEFRLYMTTPARRLIDKLTVGGKEAGQP